MLNALINYVRAARQRRAENKKAGCSLDFAQLLDDAQKERERLWENPPPCGPVIRYVPECIYEEAYGEFLFSAADVEQALKNALREYPNLVNGDEGAMLNWVQKRDESLAEPTDVPSIWSRFKYVSDNLVRAGKADIYCLKCKAEIRPDQITKDDDRNKPSWNFNRAVCPKGHKLLVVETVHYTRG